MAKKEIKRVRLKVLTHDALMSETESLSIPVVFSGLENVVSLSTKWLNEDIEEIAKKVGCVSGPLHTAAYWATNPIQKMFEGRCQYVDLDKFFNSPIYQKGSYYISHHRYLHGNAVPAKAFFSNKFDDFVAKNIPVFDFSSRAALIVSWFSRGGTKSNLHADPLHNLFCQISGEKKIFLIKERQNTLRLRERLAPHLMKFRNPYGCEAKASKSFSGLDFYEFTLLPGEALFLPVWMFHHIEALEESRNISIAYMFSPDLVDKLTSVDYWMARFYRRWYPRVVAKSRRHFERTILRENGVPFLRPGTQLVRQAAKNPDLVKDHPYYIFGEKIKPLSLSESHVISVLLAIDGIADVSVIAEKCSLSQAWVEDILQPFILNRLVGVYPKNSSDNAYNWRHQLNEVI